MVAAAPADRVTHPAIDPGTLNRRIIVNDATRIKAIEADEGLMREYRKWRKLRHPAGRHIRYYVRENRAAIDAAIGAVPAEQEQWDHRYEPGAYEVCRRCGGERHPGPEQLTYDEFVRRVVAQRVRTQRGPA